MKKGWKLLTLVVAVLMLAACVVNAAGPYDEAFDNLAFSEFALYEQGTLDAVQLRAFATDPNGKYYYGGFLNSGTPTVYQFSATDGKEVCTYTFDDDPGSYIKAIAADDRGYVYMGIANPSNNGAVYFAICKENGLEQVKYVEIQIEGKIGVNGAAIWNNNGTYYLYFVTNYDTDRIYCYDVTDVANPKLNTAFGNTAEGGYVQLDEIFGITDANNICVASDGSIYMAANKGSGSKGDTVFKISKAGTGLMNETSVSECFGVCAIGGYLAVCSYEGADSKVTILNSTDLSTVKVVGYDNANNFCQMGLIGNRIFMCDQGPDAVLVSTEINFPAEEAAEEVAEEVTADEGELDVGEDGVAFEEGPADAPATADSMAIAAASLMLAAAACIVLNRKH